jgi:cell division protein FtsA
MLKKFKKVKDKVTNSGDGPEEKLMIGLDIGTEYVKAVIAKVEPGNDLKIIGVGRQKQSLSDMNAGAISDITAVVANCDSALSEAEQMAGASGRSAVIGIAGELVKGNTTIVRFARKDPNKEITVEEVDRIFTLVQERAETVAKNSSKWKLVAKILA